MTVIQRDPTGACGGPGTPTNGLQVNHGGGVITVYLHLASFSVADGSWVDQNTQIGVMDSTGYNVPCPTNHLHFEKRVNGVRVDPGPLQACHGAAMVSYPSAVGYSSWDAIPPYTQTVSSTGTGCGGGGSSSTSYTGATAGDYGDSVTLSARLVDVATSGGLSGRSMAFTLGTQSCSGTTDGSGGASCSVALAQAPGVYTVKASFAGDATFSASSDSKPFTIRQKATKTTYTGPASSDYYDAFTASATLTDPVGGAPIAGKPMTITLGAGDSCGGVSDASGTVSCSITPTQPAGVYSIVASFGSDALYLASSDTKPFTITKEETVTTVVAVPPTSSKFGQPVTFTAVSAADPPPGAPTPTGSTAFAVDGAPVGSSALPAGSASITTAALPAGPHTISATYGGDHNYLPSSGTLPYNVTCDVNISGRHEGALSVTTTTCLAAGAQVDGAIIVEPGAALDIEGATITGSIGASHGAGVIRVCGSSIAGAVDVKESTGIVLVGDPIDGCASNVVGGALSVKNNTNGVEVVGNTVGGAILVDGNSGPGPYPGEVTTISGNHNSPTGTPAGAPGTQSGAGTGAPAAPGTTMPQGARPDSGSAPSSTPNANTSGTGSDTNTPTLAPGATSPAARSPHVVLTAKRPTQSSKLAAAIHACDKVKKATRRSCIATARKRHPSRGQQPKTSKSRV